MILSVLLGAQEQSQSFKTSVISIPPKNMSMGYFVDVPRPTGAIMLTGIAFQMYNAETNMPYPIEDVYNHHIFFARILELYGLYYFGWYWS